MPNFECSNVLDIVCLDICVVGGATPSELQQLTQPVVDSEICNQQQEYMGKITDNMICAGYM